MNVRFGMGFVYVTEHGSTVGIDGGNIVIRYKDKSEKILSKETVEWDVMIR